MVFNIAGVCCIVLDYDKGTGTFHTHPPQRTSQPPWADKIAKIQNLFVKQSTKVKKVGKRF